jgi:GNAT superfamily N-acetyltransferase
MTAALYSVRTLLDPSDADLAKAVEVLNAAYATSEPALYAAAGPDHFADILPALNAANLKAAALAGEIYVAEDHQGKFVGVGIGFGPGREIFDSEDQTTQALHILVSRLPPDVHAWNQTMTPQIDQFKTAAFGNASKTQWCVQRLGVLPEYQRRGIGSRLVKHICNKSSGYSVTSQATDDRCIKLYTSLGFKIRAFVPIDAPHGSFTLTALMWSSPS